MMTSAPTPASISASSAAAALRTQSVQSPVQKVRVPGGVPTPFAAMGSVASPVR